jgi:hypothetical protein
MSKSILFLYIICASAGVLLALMLLPDSYSLLQKIGAGLFSGIGCILILTAARMLKPDNTEE